MTDVPARDLRQPQDPKWLPATEVARAIVQLGPDTSDLAEGRWFCGGTRLATHRPSIPSPDEMGIDLHIIEPTADGGGDQIQLDGITRWHYPPPTTGSIDDHPVRCCTVECQVASHLGYEPDDQDRSDMAELARHFQIELPAPYTAG